MLNIKDVAKITGLHANSIRRLLQERKDSRHEIRPEGDDSEEALQGST